MKQVNIKLSKEDAELVKAVLEIEKLSVEAYRIAMKEKKTKYEKSLKRIAEEIKKNMEKEKKGKNMPQRKRKRKRMPQL